MKDDASSLSIAHRADRGRPSVEAVAEARTLVETTALPLRLIAARVGMPRSTLSKLKTRHGWRRPLPERVALEGRRGGGHPIVPEVVAEARALLEGTGPDGRRLTFKEIAARTGVSPATLCRWRKRRRWQRPPGEDDRGHARLPRYPRGRGLPYAADAVGAAKRLITTTLLSQKAIARQIGVSQAQVSVWARKHGWERPPERPRARSVRWLTPDWVDTRSLSSGDGSRFAASRRDGPLKTEGDRRGRPYAREVRRDARQLWELTRLSTAIIGARVGAHAGTIARWAKEGGWERPHGRAGAAQLRGFFAVLKRGG